MSTIGVITNPHARAVSSDPLLARRLAQIGGGSTLVVETRDLEELTLAVREFAARGVQVIASCGGDGTNFALLTEMIRVYGDRLPPLALLRGGTVNTVARNLSIQGTPEDILARLVAFRRRGLAEPTEIRSVLCVNGVYGFFFGAAFPARFYEAYNASATRGLARAAVMATRIISSSIVGGRYSRKLFEPVAATISANGQTLPHRRFTLLVASTLMDVGLGIRITYRALERPNLFHLVATGLPPLQLARQLHKALMARPLTGSHHFDLVASEARLEFEAPQRYTIDGDLFQSAAVTIATGPRIQLSVP